MLDKFKVLRNAETYVVNRQFGRAISEYRSLLETKGEDPALLNTLGDLLLKNKEQAEALSHFRRVAQIFLESGFTNKAIAVCKKIYKLDPTDRETVGQLADLYTKRGFQSQAAKYYRQLVAESRDAGRFQEAADWQKHLLTVLPGEPEPFAEMAELNLELEEANGALGNFVAASWLSFNKGAYQESVEYAEQALSVDELSEAASRLKEVASSVLADGESVLSDPAFQLDDGLFASVVSFKAEEPETATESPAGTKSEELVTAPRTAESNEGTGEPVAKVEEDWSKGQETVDDYSAVGEFAGDTEEEASASEAEVSDELVTAAEAESEPEAETVHELSDDIIDNDLQDVEELLKDVAQIEADSEQHPEDFGMVEGAKLGEQDVRVGGTVDGFERYGEVLGGDEIGESPTEPVRPEQSEKLLGALEEVSAGIDAADEEVTEGSDEGQQDSEAVEAAAVEDDAAQDTLEDDRIEGLVGTDEHLQEDTLAEEVDETIPEQALASEVDSGESLPTFAKDEQSVSGVVEIPEDIETLEEPFDELVEGDELAAPSVPGEDDDIFEVSVEESAEVVLERLEEVPSESEEAELGCESGVGEPREDETVLEIADDFSSEELSSVSVEDLFEEAVSAEASLDSTEESLEQTLDVDEIEEFGSKESDTAVTIQGFEPSEDKSAAEEGSAEHQTIDRSSEESVLDQEFLHKPYDYEPQSDREELEEPKLEAIDQEIFKAFQEPPSFWDKLKDTVMGRSSDVDEEEVADEDASEEVFDAIETVESVAGENVEDERIDDAESGWGFAEVVEGVEEEVVEEERTCEAESFEETGEAVHEEILEAAEVVEGVKAEVVKEEDSHQVESELEAGEVVEATSEEEAEETPTFEAVESEEVVTSQPTVDAGESAEDVQAEGVGEEIAFETESARETGVVSPEEVVEPVEAVESLTAEGVEEEAVGEEAPETEDWEAVGDVSVEESEETLKAEDQIGEESETVRVQDSAEEAKLEADEQTTGEVFEEQHSFWDKLRDAVMGGASDGDEEEAGANVSEEVIEVREAVEGAVEEVVEDEHAYEAESEQEVSEAVPDDVIEGRESDQEEFELVAEEADEELNAVSDQEVETDLKAVEVAEGDSAAIVETEEVDEEATEVGLVALEDGGGSILEKGGEPEKHSDPTGEGQADTTGEDEWVAKEEEETAYEVAQAEETAPEEVVEAVHAEVVEAAEVVVGAVEEVVDEQGSDREELELEAVETAEAESEEEAEEELEAVSDEEGEDELEAAEAAEGDVEEIVEHKESDEEEPRYEITGLWRKLLKKTLGEDETEDVVEPGEVETIAAVEPESEWEAPQDLGVEDESAEERELEAQENLDAEGEPAEVETPQLAQEDDSAVEPQAEERDHEAPVVDPEMEKSRDHRTAVTETWKQPSVYADSPPSRDVEDVTSRDAPTVGWQPKSDEPENGDRKQDLGSLEEALQEYDFNIKLGLREEAERIISQLLAEHACDERVLLRAKSHGISLPSTEPESELVAEGEKTIEDELDSAFEDIFKMPGDEIPEDVLVFELDTADNTPSDESKVQYDLGLGYREMGLLDDAVEKFEEAFQVAIDSDDRDHATNCCGMLASTYMELTDYRKVLEWADRGLGLHVAKAFEEKTLQYERAQAFEMLGEFRQSLDTYRALMEQDPAFRDVRARVGRLNLLSN